MGNDLPTTIFMWGLIPCSIFFQIVFLLSEKFLNLIAVGNATKSLLNLIAVGNATKAQSDPPRVPITELFRNANYPEGEVMNYKDEYETILL